MNKGYMILENDIADALYKQNISGSELSVLWMVIRYTKGFKRDSAKMSISYISKGTGLPYGTVRRALTKLINSGRVEVVKEAYGNRPAELKLGSLLCPKMNTCSKTDTCSKMETHMSKNEQENVSKNEHMNMSKNEHQENTSLYNTSLYSISKEIIWAKNEREFLKFLPERMRVLHPEDLEDENDWDEWMSKRDAWEAYHGDRYPEEDRWGNLPGRDIDIPQEILREIHEREDAFLESLPENMRALNIDDLPEPKVQDLAERTEAERAIEEEWRSRKKEWEAEHGDIYAPLDKLDSSQGFTQRETAFLNSLPERMRVLDPDDLENEEDWDEWIARRNAWIEEHGDIHPN